LHYKSDYKSKAIEFSIGYDEKQATERKTTLNKGGNVYLESTSTQSDQNVWFIESKESFHMTPHRELFCEYLICEWRDVFLQDDLETKIVGRGRVRIIL
jgi:hypothetical protein